MALPPDFYTGNLLVGANTNSVGLKSTPRWEKGCISQDSSCVLLGSSEGRSSSSRKIEKPETPFKTAHELTSIAAIRYQEYLCAEGKKRKQREKGIVFISPLHNSFHRSKLQATSAAKPIQLFKQSFPPVSQWYLWGTICLCPSQPLPGPVPCSSTACSASFPLKFISCFVAENVFWSPAVAHHCPAIILHEYFLLNQLPKLRSAFFMLEQWLRPFPGCCQLRTSLPAVAILAGSTPSHFPAFHPISTTPAFKVAQFLYSSVFQNPPNLSH